MRNRRGARCSTVRWRSCRKTFSRSKWTSAADPFSYVWDTMEHRWPRRDCRGADADPDAGGVSVIVAKYFETVVFGIERVIARILAIDPALVEAVARRLEREGTIARGVRIDGHPGAVSLLSRFA